MMDVGPDCNENHLPKAVHETMFLNLSPCRWT